MGSSVEGEKRSLVMARERSPYLGFLTTWYSNLLRKQHLDQVAPEKPPRRMSLPILTLTHSYNSRRLIIAVKSA
jgi:hypothetical protein